MELTLPIYIQTLQVQYPHIQINVLLLFVLMDHFTYSSCVKQINIINKVRYHNSWAIIFIFITTVPLTPQKIDKSLLVWNSGVARLGELAGHNLAYWLL